MPVVASFGSDGGDTMKPACKFTSKLTVYTGY